MNRYNVFYLIHKGLRAMLYDAATTLQQTDFADISAAAPALAKVNEVLFAFEHHAHHEDNFILPAVEAYEPEIAFSFESEHQEDYRLAGRLRNLLIIYENSFLHEERTICGSAITKSFTEFLTFNLQHIAKEELLLNHALWRLYTDAQIKAIQQQLMATITTAELQSASRWIMRVISTADAIEWLKTVRQSSAGIAFDNLMKIAAEELGEARFATVQEGLEEAMAA
ncbi:MAG TPA: hemerythrin domain-containing protein [Parafilimonas sp.]|nr:hemerythrin domain-containing protein [Parafilimonas sp.]